MKKQYAPKIPFIPTYHHSGLPRQPKKYSRPDNASKMDLSGIIVGSKVIHKVFGEGIVQKIQEGSSGQMYIFIMFDKNERSFGFPEAFYDGYLNTVSENEA